MTTGKQAVTTKTLFIDTSSLSEDNPELNPRLAEAIKKVRSMEEIHSAFTDHSSHSQHSVHSTGSWVR